MTVIIMPSAGMRHLQDYFPLSMSGTMIRSKTLQGLDFSAIQHALIMHEYIPRPDL